MTSKTLVGTVAALALGLAGVAGAQSGTGQSGTQGSQTGQSGSKSGATGSSASESDTSGSAAGTETKGTAKSGMSDKPVMGKPSEIPSIKLSALDESQVIDLQTRLQELGFYKAEVDGKVGRQTRAALSQWFRQQLNMINQGRVSEAGLSGLGFSDTDIERVRGVDEDTSGTSTGTGTSTGSKSQSKSSSGSGTSGSDKSGSGTQGGTDKSGNY